MNYQSLLAARVTGIEDSGIRKIFDLAASVKDAINLSIGQPDFDVPDPIKDLAIDAIRGGFNRYPPGARLTEDEKRALADLARAKGVILVSDEIYELFHYGEHAAKSLGAYYPEGTLAVGGLSKTLAMTGWRVGWVTGPHALLTELTK